MYMYNEQNLNHGNLNGRQHRQQERIRSHSPSKKQKEEAEEKFYLAEAMLKPILKILERYKVFSTYFAIIDLCEICVILINAFCPSLF